MTRGTGSTNAVAAGAIRVGNAVGAVLSNRRVLGPVEARLTILSGLALCIVSALIAIFPRALAIPLAIIGLWSGIALLLNGARLRRKEEAAPVRSAQPESAAPRLPPTPT